MSRQQPHLESLFLAALEIHSAEERASYLARSCGDNLSLRQEVEKLLASHQAAGSFLETPAVSPDATLRKAQRQDLAASFQAGLSPAFHEEEAVVFGRNGHSVIKSLGQTIHFQSVVLRTATDGNDPIVRPKSPEMPERISDSRYQLQGEIARGGMGAILKGRDVDLGRDLAIKVLLDRHRDNPQVIQRFIEEAQIGGQLQHPGIAPVYELGQFSDQRPYFSMKLVNGETLSKLLADRQQPAAERGKFLGIFEQVCQTMAYCHSRGVIHRDLKPANIMVGTFGEVQVMDWGLAKVLPTGGVADEKKARQLQQGQSTIQTLRSKLSSDSTGSVGSLGSQTQMGSVMGTPAYMPPEQALGEVDQLDERADVFGLGAILCEILTGKPPYVGDDGTEIFRQACHGTLDDCQSRLDACGADTELIALARACLEPEAANRPRDAGVLAARVSGYLESVETRLHETELAKAAAQARTEELRRRHKLTFAAGAAIAASLVVGIGASVWQAVRATRAEVRAVAAFDELRATAPAFAEQARALVAREHFDEAVAKLDYAIKLQPAEAKYLVAQADLLQAMLRLREAAAMYRKALTIEPGLASAATSAKLCEELLAAPPGPDGKPSRETLARLHLAMEKEQRPAAELMPVARLLGEEKKLLIEYWLARLKDLPVSAERPLKDRLTLREDGRLAIDLSDTKVVDLSPVASAPLSALNASGCQELSDLSPLRGLDLVELNVSHTSVADLASLSEMHMLEKLDMTGSKVTDLSALSSLRLTNLNFSACLISDLTPIRHMALLEMNLSKTRVADLSPIIGMPIKTIDLGETPVLDFSPLAQLPLEKCYLTSSRIQDLAILRGKTLTELVLLGCNAARNFAVLTELPTLELVLLPSAYRTLPAEDYDAIGLLRNLPRLRQLSTHYSGGLGVRTVGVTRTSGTEPTDAGAARYAATPAKEIFWQDWDREQTFLPALRKSGFNFSLTKLSTGYYDLFMREQPIRDLSFLTGAPISQLQLIGGGVSDLSPIKDMPLVYLNIPNNPVSDLSPLRGMPLERMFLTGTQVSDLTPLIGLPIKSLFLRSCKNVTDVAPLAKIPTLENLVLPPNAKNIEALRKLPRLQRLGYEIVGLQPMLAETTAEEFWKEYDAARNKSGDRNAN